MKRNPKSEQGNDAMQHGSNPLQNIRALLSIALEHDRSGEKTEAANIRANVADYLMANSL